MFHTECLALNVNCLIVGKTEKPTPQNAYNGSNVYNYISMRKNEKPERSEI
jgi:hypothetical protein